MDKTSFKYNMICMKYGFMYEKAVLVYGKITVIHHNIKKRVWIDAYLGKMFQCKKNKKDWAKHCTIQKQVKKWFIEE